MIGKSESATGLLLENLSLMIGDAEIPICDQEVRLFGAGDGRVLSLQVSVHVISKLAAAWQRVVHAVPALKGNRPTTEFIPGHSVSYSDITERHTRPVSKVSYVDCAYSNVLYVNAAHGGASALDVRYSDVCYSSAQHCQVLYSQASQSVVHPGQSVVHAADSDRGSHDEGEILTLTGTAHDARRVVICLSGVKGIDISVRSPQEEMAILKLEFLHQIPFEQLFWVINGTRRGDSDQTQPK